MLAQRQPQINIERLNIVEEVDAREQLSINQDAMILRIVNSLPANFRVHDLVMEFDRTVFFSLLEHTSGGVEASVPEYQWRDYCRSFFSHALKHGGEPVFVDDRIVL